MEMTKNKNATIKKQSSAGCFSMFTLSFSITFIPAFLTNRQELISRGLLVPVYEEIVFRGCLFNSFKFWFNDNIYTSAIVTSVIFSALHLQYTDFHTFLMLFLVSLVLISAKIKSNGLLMPILLHMSMNAVIAGIQYLASISYTH